MKILYIDQIVGISGDMLLSALLDLSSSSINQLLSMLPIGKDLKSEIKLKKVKKNSITAKMIHIPEIENEISYNNFIKLVDKTKFDEDIKQKVKQTLLLIAKTEAKIHNKKFPDFHFHNFEDLLIELFGVFYLIKNLSIERVYSSQVKISHGFVKCIHGMLPVPAPATLEILKNMPTEYINISDETTTPTGVALLKVLTPTFEYPTMVVKKIGYGAGNKNFVLPNILRVILGEQSYKDYFDIYDYDTVIKIETNIDNMNPVIYEEVVEKLYSCGCYEVFLTNTINKKFRPGILITSLLPQEKLYDVVKNLFLYSTTTGIRIQRINRIKLFREEKIKNTKYGKIKVKVVKLPDGSKKVYPEYNDVKNVAKKFLIPTKNLLDELSS